MIRDVALGPLGLRVGAQGLGCLNLTGFYGKPFDQGMAHETLDRALELGVTLLDTADVYGVGADTGFGGNETFLGRAIRGKRESVVLSTKFGWLRPTGRDSQQDLARMGVSSATVRSDPAYVHAACEESLQRLGTDYIDLYFCHRLNAEVPVEETIGAMAELVEAGKVRFLGLSGVSAPTLSLAASVHPITAVENEWSLWTRDIEADVVPTARQLGVGVIPYAPLGRGMLTGRLRAFDDLSSDDYRRHSPRFQRENFARNLERVDHVRQLADKKSCTPAQLALAWLHAQGTDVVPIPGGDRPEYETENVGALDVELSADDLSAIDVVFPLGAAAGDRYTDMSSASDNSPQ